MRPPGRPEGDCRTAQHDVPPPGRPRAVPVRQIAVPIGLSIVAWAAAWAVASRHRVGGEDAGAAAAFALAALATLACTLRVLWLTWRLRAASLAGTAPDPRRTRAALWVGVAWCVAMAGLAFVVVFGLG